MERGPGRWKKLVGIAMLRPYVSMWATTSRSNRRFLSLPSNGTNFVCVFSFPIASATFLSFFIAAIRISGSSLRISSANSDNGSSPSPAAAAIKLENGLRGGRVKY